MPQFASDNCTGANNTRFVDRLSTSGHTWRVSGISTTPGSSQTPIIISNEGLSAVSSGEAYMLYLDAAPASADYSVTADVKAGADSSGDVTGPGIRVSASSVAASSNGYAFATATTGFRLRRYDAGIPVALSNIVTTITAGVVYRITVAAAGSTITGKVQRLSDSQWLTGAGAWQASETNCFSTTDATHSAAGRPAIITYGAGNLSTFDNFSADEAGGGTAPSITTQPSNQSVTAGATAAFTAAASGSPAPTYQWQRNPGGVGSWADIASATSASYTTPATTVSGGTANDGDTYRVVATNASGSATSTAATLTVSASNAAPTFTGPSISNLSLSQGVAMTAVNVASKFSDTDALTFSAIGTWPAGITVSSAGVISGTPTVVGNYTGLTVRATDTAAQTVDSNTFSIAVTAVTATLNFQAAGMEFGARTGLGIATFALDVGSGYRYTVHADGLTLGAALYTSAVVNTDSAGKLPNLVDASITAGVTYRVCAIRQSDGAAATFRMTAA